MKRYWKLVVIVAAAVFSVGTFYINSAMSASSSYPEFVIEKQSGDEQVVKPISINGFWAGNGGSLKITSNGSLYSSELSFYDRISGTHQPIEMKQLQRDYRNFMRGKSGLSSFYDGEDFLAYANVLNSSGIVSGDSKLEVAVLDKKENSQSSFKLPLPDEGKYKETYVEDVQMVDGQLKVITRNFSSGQDFLNDTEIHVYSLDISAKKISSDETILTTSNGSDNGDTYVDLIRGKDVTKASNYVYFNRTETKETKQDNGISSEQEVSKELIAYNLKTEKQEKITLPEKISESASINGFDDSIIYFTEISKSGVKVMAYDKSGKAIEGNFTIQLPETKNENQPITEIKDGKLYVFASTNENSEIEGNVIVGDLKSGKILYRGEVTKKNTNVDREDHSLLLNEIEIQ